MHYLNYGGPGGGPFTSFCPLTVNVIHDCNPRGIGSLLVLVTSVGLYPIPTVAILASPENLQMTTVFRCRPT